MKNFILILLLVCISGIAKGAPVKEIFGKLKVTSTTDGSHPCPSMTDAQMLAIVAPEDGDCVHNTTLGSWLVYNSTDTVWEQVGGAGGGISEWVTATDYEIGNVVIESNRIYKALTNHTSGTFATDLAGGDWVLISDEFSFESENGFPTSYKNLRVPNHQVIQTALGEARLETGNKNKLQNPGFEHLVPHTGWTSTVTGTATATPDTDVALEEGLQSGKLTCVGGASGGTCTIYQDVTTVHQIQGLVSAYVKTDNLTAVKVYSRKNGANLDNVDVRVAGPVLYKLPITLGTSSTGIAVQVTVTAGQTVNISIDDAFVGADDLEYYTSTTTYSSTNSDTSWASCGLTTASFNGLGTVSNIDIQCKRIGDDLHMRGRFTAGTTTASEARINLPVWNGTQLTSKNTTYIGSIQLAGEAGLNAAVSNQYRVLMEPSVNYVTFGIQSGTRATLTKVNGDNFATSGQVITFWARVPINGWSASNVIIGQFKDVLTSIGSTTADVQMVYFGSGANCSSACTTGTCTICRQKGNLITSVTWQSAGNYRINGIDGATKYQCTGSAESANYSGVVHYESSSSTTYAHVVTGGASPANGGRATVFCIGIP